MKICINCKEVIKDDSNFCPYCGMRVENLVKETSGLDHIPAYYEDNSQFLEINSGEDSKRVSKKSNVLKAIGIIVCVLLGAELLMGILADDEQSRPTVAEPASGQIISGMEVEGESQITVTSESNEACLVKLKTTGGATEMEFYVRAGDTVTVGVPYKLLYIYFASGSSWYGSEELFGENTDYSKDDTVCNFDEYTYTYTLYPVADGNFSQTPIDAEEF